MDKNYFATRFRFDPARRAVWRAITENLQGWIDPRSSILELGAGYCDFINQISAGEKYALDMNRDVAEFCAPNVKFLHSGVEQIALPAESVDTVFASNFFEHLTDQQLYSLSRNLKVLLKPGGKLILLQPNIYYAFREYWDDYTHIKAFSHISLANFVQSQGYTVLHAEKRFLPFSMKSSLPKSYRLTKLYLQLPWRPFAKQMLLIAEKTDVQR